MCNNQQIIDVLISDKGNSLIDFPKDCVIIDLETTGLSYRYDEIIELAAIRIRNGEPTETFNRLVRPSKRISELITSITGITNEMVCNEPSIGELIGSFCDFCGTDIIIGHNVVYDLGFIRMACAVNLLKPFLNDYVDTVRLSKLFLPNIENHKLGTVYNHLKLPPVEAHRALNDCVMTWAVVSTFRIAFDGLTDEEKDQLFYRACNRQLTKHKYIHKDKTTAKDICCTVPEDEIDKSNALYGKSVCFTGKMIIERAEAMQIIKNLGAVPCDSVTKKTDYLVIGGCEYIGADGSRSGKVKKAEKILIDGGDIRIIDERTFFEMIDD